MARSAKKSTKAKKSPVQAKKEVAPAPVAQIKQNRSQMLLVVLLIIVSFFSGYLFFKLKSLESGGVAGQPVAPQKAADVKAAKPDVNKDHFRGSQNARYVWVEYSDLECPFCKSIHPNLIKIMQDYDGKLAWVYRHYPLSFHANAQKEAEATECAAELGGNDAFWKYTDAIYERTTSNGTGFALDKLVPLATEQGLNATAFKECLDSNKYAQKVKDQFAQGTREGVQATPTSVIFDMKTGKTTTVEGAVPYEQLKQALDQALSGS